MGDGSRSMRTPQYVLLELIQRGEPHVYAMLTRDGAIKIGISGDLMQRKRSIAFGGCERFLGFVPGDYEDERAIHAAIPDDVRLPGRREYYYPLYEHVLDPVNRMRAAMTLPPLNRRDLPRTGYWARHLPRPDGPTSWPQPRLWDLLAAS